MIIKAIVLILFGFIFYSLGSAFYFLLRDKQSSTRVIKALTWRISLSILLIILLIIAYAFGWITPHGVGG